MSPRTAVHGSSPSRESAAASQRLRTRFARAVLMAAWVLSGVALALFPWDAGAAEPGTESRLILAHYMPWYEAKPTSAAWGWHWTMNAFDPDEVVDGRRRIAAKLYPAIGPYDSGDPHVLEYHLLLMKLAGIDGVIVDWYGRRDLWDYARIHANASRLVEMAGRLRMKVAICYEDKTITQLVKQGRIAAKDRVTEAVAEVRWLSAHWFAQPHYARLADRPVLLSFGREGLGEAEWQRCLDEARVPVAYFSEHDRRPAAVGGFDWPVPNGALAEVDRFLTRSREWPARIPVAYPRFLDMYAEARVQPSFGAIADDEGATFRRSLERGLEAGAPIVQIATWNDWGEGTAVEPSLEFGTRDLEVVQNLRRRHLDPAFAGHVDHLALPGRLLTLRRAVADDARRARIDRVIERIVDGDLARAVAEVVTLERP